jgi:hypothetical protein
MIYLIDDKHIRQRDFGWPEERFSNFVEFIKPLYTLDEILDVGDDLYSDNNIILYHESFLDFTNDRNKAIEQRKKISQKANFNKLLSVVFFSGSQSSRTVQGNIADIPVALLYRNLELFVYNYSLNNKSLKYLLFGESPEIEEELSAAITNFNKEIEIPAVEITGRNVFMRPNTRYIQNAILNSKERVLFSDVSDEKLSEKVNEWLGQEEFDNIFIPLCFGDVLSDYNGLRLAAHIRCSENVNQFKRIFIYSFVDINELIQNDYFGILKSKNVHLIGYKKSALRAAGNSSYLELLPVDLPNEILKLNLQTPKNYTDSHAIVNEWSILQWSRTIGCEETDELRKVFKNVQNNIYFKYLRTIQPIPPECKFSSNELSIKFEGSPKVLLIDDESEKGWSEIFGVLLWDKNNIYFDYIGNDFKSLSSDEIVRKSLEKIVDEDFDVVVVDFRLTQLDFDKSTENEKTSLRLIKEIKKKNLGIQVIGFSATSKIWNLKSLEAVGVNGFTPKGNPFVNDKNFVKDSISGFIQNLQECFKLNFLKEFYKDQVEIENDLIPRLKLRHERPLPKEFVNEALKWLNLSNEVLSVGYLSEAKIVSSFIFKFSVLESLANRIIDSDQPILVRRGNNNEKIFQFQYRLTDNLLMRFKEDKNNKGFYRKTNEVFESNGQIPWAIKILNTITFLSDKKLSEEELTIIVKKRNDFIHANTTTGDKVNISIADLVFLNNIITVGLKNIA